MSAQISVYIGAYLVIKAKKVPAPSPFVCPDKSHDKEFWKQDLIEHRFCQKCGQKLVQATPRVKTPNLWDLLPDNNDEFYEVESYGTDEPTIILSNIHPEGSPDHVRTDHLDFNKEVKLAPIIMTKFTENFLANHEKSIEILRAASEEITVKFGVVQYYS